MKIFLDSCRVLLEHAKIEQVEESLSYSKDTKLVYSKEPHKERCVTTLKTAV